LSMSGKRDGCGTLAGVFSKTFRTSPTVERDPRIVLGKLCLNSVSQESSICIMGRGLDHLDKQYQQLSTNLIKADDALLAV